MKIDRRSFLALSIGSTAGIHLTPLPWKLMDDMSIWTQNWPWTPVPQDGAASYVNSVCGLCTAGCGIRVRKIENRAVKIEGLPGHPVNDGRICSLGLSGLQLLYGGTRVKTPLKRMGERGAGQWQKISWKQAIDEISKKLSEQRKSGNPQTLGAICSSDRGTTSHLLNRFLTVYGSPNFLRTPSVQSSYEMTTSIMNGSSGTVGFDLENSDYILSFGSGLLDGWVSPVRMIRAHSIWKDKKARVVQIEPRLSHTAAKADQWIAIKPGTNAALALGIAHVIIKEKLYDKNFVEKYGFGFEEWKDEKGQTHKGFKQSVLENYTPANVAEITGIDVAAIISVAKDFAKSAKPVALCGSGDGGAPVNLNEMMAVHALNALKGAINNKGGLQIVPNPDYILWPESEMDKTASKGIQTERVDGAGGKKYAQARSLLNRLPEVINASSESPLQTLLVYNANPIYTMADSVAVKEAFSKIPLIVSFSPYMDETASYSDYILPNHTYLERYEDSATPYGSVQPLISLAKPVINPLFNTKQTGDVIISLAKAMGGHIAKAFPWKNYRACLEKTLGDKWKTLAEHGYIVAKKDKAPDTASAKFDFAAQAVNTDSKNDAVAPADFKPADLDGDAKAFPLVLIPYDTMRLASGFVGTPPFVIKTVGDYILKENDSCVDINPQTAAKLGLTEGNKVILTTPKNKASVRVHLSEGILPGLIALPRGLGHSAYDKFLAGKGVNFNALYAPMTDPISGLDMTWGVRAKISKA
ncbi:molybdopterin-dependent oxidoreductase [Desulfococcaceae bacterium HSG7]|nr:molybdopterin-dependent oxidoreductase [Desulfococcaceae bacterium HSG7]